MRTVIATILLLGVLNGTAGAYDRFVNPRGTCGAGTVGGKPQHATIQEAVDASSPGDEIGVCPDTYFEGATVPAAKSGISLTGIGVVILEAISIPSFSGFEIEADDVTVQRFEIRGFDTAGILVQANRATLQNNNIHHNDGGIGLIGDGHRVRNNVIEASVAFGIVAFNVNGLEISGNRLTGGDTGMLALQVDLVSPGTVIHHNLVVGTQHGIGVFNAAGGSIRNNTVRFTADDAIVVDGTTAVTIVQNLVQKNGGSGIRVNSSTGCGVGLNSVNFNGIFGTGHGIDLTGIDGCVITRNNVSRNNPPDCFWDGSGTNTFAANACGSEDPAGAWD